MRWGYFLLSLLIFLLSPIKAMAACGMSVVPAAIRTGASGTFSVTLDNTTGSTINWMRVWVEDENVFALSSVAASGWSWTDAVLTGGNLTDGGSVLVSVSGVGGGSNGSTRMLIETSSDGGGSTEMCGEGATIEISDRVAANPVISGLTLSVADTSATISWSTDIESNGTLQYGVSNAYGGEKSHSDYTTSHSLAITGLSASTTYHYRILASEGSGGTSATGDLTFTTGATNTVTTTTTVTNTVTNTLEQTVTKIITDTTPPIVRIDELTKVFESAPLITGSVSDDRGVARVEYRIKDRETAWSSASLEGSVGGKKMEWEFLPPVSLDGTYTIEIRGVDVFGNISAPKTVEFVIDQLLPTVGGGVISYGALPMYAAGGVVTVLAGLEYEVVLYEAGGADRIVYTVSGIEHELEKIGSQGLWRGLLKLDQTGEFISKFKAVDGAGNETEREWVAFKVMPNSKQAGELYYLDPTTKRFGLWEANEYGQKQGEIGWYVPAGEYYVKDNNVVSQRIVMAQDGWISGEWQVEPKRWWEKLFNFRKLGKLSLPETQTTKKDRSLIVGREMWIGKKSLVYVGTPTLPWYEETKQRAMTWAEEQGAELVELVVQGEDDPKGEWLEKLKVGLLPQVYLINDRGDTVDYKEGVWVR